VHPGLQPWMDRTQPLPRREERLVSKWNTSDQSLMNADHGGI
jgi:hypothetical protein